MIKINRIDFIVELTKNYHTLIDIGSDHGFVIKRALDKGYIKKGIATDVNEGPLNNAKKTLTGYPVEFYLSDGFKDVKQSYDLAVITGMGGLLISNIMNYSNEDATYILGPNDRVSNLREYLANNNYKIIDEYVIYDDFFYVFIKVIKGKMILTDSDLYLGPILKIKPEAKAYYKQQIEYYEDIILKSKGKTDKINYQILDYFQKSIL